MLYGWRSHGGLAGVFPAFLVRDVLFRPRLLSLPYSDYGGPLYGDEGLALQALAEIVDKFKSMVKLIEIRGNIPAGSVFKPLNYYKSHRLNLLLGLPELQKKIDKKTIQYSIRKAERSGLVTREANDLEGMEEFYRLNQLTRKKHGVPSQPKAFFANVLTHVILRGSGFLVLAYHQDRAVAGSLFLTSGKRIHYKFNVSDPSVLGKLTPNHALTWHAIKKGCEEGYESIDFGRSSPDNEGLMRYKAMWGNTVREALYFYYPEIRGASSMQEEGRFYKTFTDIWRRIPAPITDKIGPLLYRKMT
jgi:CelD/BcsL family acetyltransferase involved in cellulose biosynthesis